MSILIALITGLAIGVAAWFAVSYFTTSLILAIEKKYPHLVGTRLLRVAEVTVCGTAVLACLTFGFWLGIVIWLTRR